jgi:segregation and condensation protein A
VADLTELLRACLRLIELPERERVYRPDPPPLWRVPDALARIRVLLAALPVGAALEHFARPPASLARTPLQRRAALASTLLAVLELGREGELAFKQTDAFGEIHVQGAARGSATGAPDYRTGEISRHAARSPDAETA